MNTPYNKNTELHASLQLVNDRLRFTGTVPGNQPVSIDYIPPLGDNEGYTSLELLLLSLSSCVGSALLAFLRKMRKTITAFEINSDGVRRTEHPTAFTSITLRVRMTSPDVTDEDFRKVLEMTEASYCPVWAMLKGNVEVNVVHEIHSPTV